MPAQATKRLFHEAGARKSGLSLGAVDDLLDGVLRFSFRDFSHAFGLVNPTLCLHFLVVDRLPDALTCLAGDLVCGAGNLVRCASRGMSPIFRQT